MPWEGQGQSRPHGRDSPNGGSPSCLSIRQVFGHVEPENGIPQRQSPPASRSSSHHCCLVSHGNEPSASGSSILRPQTPFWCPPQHRYFSPAGSSALSWSPTYLYCVLTDRGSVRTSGRWLSHPGLSWESQDHMSHPGEHLLDIPICPNSSCSIGLTSRPRAGSSSGSFLSCTS